MKLKSIIALIFVSGYSMADQQPEVSLGLKAWNASWNSYSVGSLAGTNGTNMGEIDLFNVAGEKSKIDLVPSLAIRYDRYIFSASHTDVERDFSIVSLVNSPAQTTPVLLGRTDTFMRKEWDINFGYIVSPNFIASIGYKSGKESRDVLLAIPGATKQRIVDNKVKGLLIGASLSTALLDKIGGYAQLAYSPAKVTTTPTAAGWESIKADSHYYMTEVGLSYPLLQEPTAFVKRATVSGGYRAQIVRTESRHIASLTSGSPQQLNDTREGLVLNLNLTF